MAKEQKSDSTASVNKESAAEKKTAAKRMTPKQKAAKKKRNMIIFGIELLVLALVVTVAIIIIKIDPLRKRGNENPNLVNVKDKPVDTGSDPNATVDLGNGEVGYNPNAYENVDEKDDPTKKYMQIALFGIDSRNRKLDKSKGSRSDTIIIACVDTEAKEVRLVSVYRDTFLNLTTGSYDKCNAAYAKGGASRAMTMLNMNLDLKIDNYVTVGFYGLIDLIDALGGVWIDVKEEEIKYLNDYQISMVGKTTDNVHYTADAGKDYTPVKEAGRQKLNGLQAVAYCRIRYVGMDFARTERQRTVIQELMNEAKKVSFSKLKDIVNSSVFSEFETSIPLDTIFSLLGDIGDYQIVESCGFPAMNMMKNGMVGAWGSCIVPADLTKNVIELHRILFGTENYMPSADVKLYSEEIYKKTSPYLQ